MKTSKAPITAVPWLLLDLGKPVRAGVNRLLTHMKQHKRTILVQGWVITTTVETRPTSLSVCGAILPTRMWSGSIVMQDYRGSVEVGTYLSPV